MTPGTPTITVQGPVTGGVALPRQVHLWSKSMLMQLVLLSSFRTRWTSFTGLNCTADGWAAVILVFARGAAGNALATPVPIVAKNSPPTSVAMSSFLMRTTSCANACTGGVSSARGLAHLVYAEWARAFAGRGDGFDLPGGDQGYSPSPTTRCGARTTRSEHATTSRVAGGTGRGAAAGGTGRLPGRRVWRRCRSQYVAGWPGAQMRQPHTGG